MPIHSKSTVYTKLSTYKYYFLTLIIFVFKTLTSFSRKLGLSSRSQFSFISPECSTASFFFFTKKKKKKDKM